MLIEDYLKDIYEQFKSEVDEMSCLCELKDVNYQSGNIPDYSVKAVQLLYCLRYHFGYAFEYEYMYREILEKIKDKNEINVLSIGCGNGIDLWSLQRAINHSGRNITINYFGVDLVSWCNKISKRAGDNVKYVQCEVSNLSDEITELDDIDILIFPKSISEINNDDLKCIANFMSDITDKFIVMTSYRNSQFSLNEDMQKTEVLCDFLERKNFHIVGGDSQEYYNFPDKSLGIRSVYNDYIYPDEAKDYIETLYEKCSLFNDDDDCHSCVDIISRMPILTLNNVAYNLLEFESNNNYY